MARKRAKPASSEDLPFFVIPDHLSDLNSVNSASKGAKDRVTYRRPAIHRRKLSDSHPKARPGIFLSTPSGANLTRSRCCQPKLLCSGDSGDALRYRLLPDARCRETLHRPDTSCIQT